MTAPVQKKKMLRALVALVFVSLLIGGLVFFGAHVPDTDALVTLLSELGEVPWPLYFVIYTVLTVALVPIPIVIISSGLILGYSAIPIIVGAATLGSLISFLVSRYVLREWVTSLIAARPKLQAVERAVAHDAFRLTAFLRVSPAMPFGLFNTFAGVMPMSAREFTLATMLGVLPRAAGGVALGSGGRAVLASGDLSALGWKGIMAYGLGIGGTLAVLFVMVRVASRALKASGVDPAAGPDTVGRAGG